MEYIRMPPPNPGFAIYWYTPSYPRMSMGRFRLGSKYNDTGDTLKSEGFNPSLKREGKDLPLVTIFWGANLLLSLREGQLQVKNPWNLVDRFVAMAGGDRISGEFRWICSIKISWENGIVFFMFEINRTGSGILLCFILYTVLATKIFPKPPQ